MKISKIIVQKKKLFSIEKMNLFNKDIFKKEIFNKDIFKKDKLKDGIKSVTRKLFNNNLGSWQILLFHLRILQKQYWILKKKPNIAFQISSLSTQEYSGWPSLPRRKQKNLLNASISNLRKITITFGMWENRGMTLLSSIIKYLSTHESISF